MASAPNGASQLPWRWALTGGAWAGAVGAVIGLVVGLLTYPRTAWFAVFEVGIPVGMVGLLVGLAGGVTAEALRRRRFPSVRPPSTAGKADESRSG